jgi:hypothetical protein
MKKMKIKRRQIHAEMEEKTEETEKRKKRRCVVALSSRCTISLGVPVVLSFLSFFLALSIPVLSLSLVLVLLPLFMCDTKRPETVECSAVQCSAAQCSRHLQIYLKSLFSPSLLPLHLLLFHSLLSSVDLSLYPSLHLSFCHAIYKCASVDLIAHNSNSKNKTKQKHQTHLSSSLPPLHLLQYSILDS